MKFPVTNSSTSEQEEKQDERGSCQTLWAIKILAMNSIHLKCLEMIYEYKVMYK